MKTTPLHPRFGVRIDGVDLRRVSAADGFPQIRALFEEHSLLLFEDQQVDDAEHIRLCKLFGPMEDRSQGDPDPDPKELYGVTNLRSDGTVASAGDLRTLNLQANMLWHTDSTFLPVPALINMIVPRVLPSEGGATEFASTRAAFERLEPELKARLEQTFLWHRYSHSRARISPELAREGIFTMWPDQCWRAVWENPVSGRKALYVASHAYGVEGMGAAEGQAFVDDLLARATASDNVYAHQWAIGDVLVWDERAVLHRGTPWPYEQQRTLGSYCTTAQESDGLASIRPADWWARNRELLEVFPR